MVVLELEQVGFPMEHSEAVKTFVHLYTTHEVRLRALALSLLPSMDDANDLLQETSMVLWEKFADFSVGTNFFAWAATVMRLKAMELRRRRSRLTIQFSDQVLEQLVAEATALSELMVERERVLHDCIAKLGVRQLDLLQHRYEKKSSIRGIAEAIGRSEGSVRQALARIRSILSDCIARRMSGGELA